LQYLVVTISTHTTNHQSVTAKLPGALTSSPKFYTGSTTRLSFRHKHGPTTTPPGRPCEHSPCHHRQLCQGCSQHWYSFTTSFPLHAWTSIPTATTPRPSRQDLFRLESYCVRTFRSPLNTVQFHPSEAFSSRSTAQVTRPRRHRPHHHRHPTTVPSATSSPPSLLHEGLPYVHTSLLRLLRNLPFNRGRRDF